MKTFFFFFGLRLVLGQEPDSYWVEKCYFSFHYYQISCPPLFRKSCVPEVESSRTSSRTHFEVLGLEGQVLGLGLETSSPRKLTCPRLEDSTIFWIVKILWSAWKIFWKPFFLWRSPEKFLWRPFFFFFFFFLESTCACVLSPWPWPLAFLSLASRVSVLGKAVLGLGLGFFLCPWPWPRALCPRLHLCCVRYCTGVTLLLRRSLYTSDHRDNLSRL